MKTHPLQLRHPFLLLPLSTCPSHPHSLRHLFLSLRLTYLRHPLKTPVTFPAVNMPFTPSSATSTLDLPVMNTQPSSPNEPHTTAQTQSPTHTPTALISTPYNQHTPFFIHTSATSIPTHTPPHITTAIPHTHTVDNILAHNTQTTTTTSHVPVVLFTLHHSLRSPSHLHPYRRHRFHPHRSRLRTLLFSGQSRTSICQTVCHPLSTLLLPSLSPHLPSYGQFYTIQPPSTDHPRSLQLS